MNDLYTQRGPGIDLPAYTGPERRGTLPDRRAIVAPAPEVARALLYLAIGFIQGLAAEALWMHFGGGR